LDADTRGETYRSKDKGLLAGEVFMKAIGIIPETRDLELIELEQPQIQPEADGVDQVLIKVEEVGISTIDRRIAAGEPCEVEPGATHLVLGHEMIGRVVDSGAEFEDLTVDTEIEVLNVGDLVVPTVRRGCGLCMQCVRGNCDLCLTGLCADRGIRQLNGYMTEYVLERIGYVVQIPPDLEDVAVLLTPLSLAEKAVAATCSIGHRMDLPLPFPEHSYHHKNWGVGKTGFILGGTAVAVMAAFLLRINSLRTYLMADKPSDSHLASIIQEIGATYIEDGMLPIEQLKEQVGRIDLVIEATGAAKFNFKLAELMGMSGVLAITTPPAIGSEVMIDANSFIGERVLRSQIVFGAVSANRRHFERGVEHLRRFKNDFGAALKKVITHRYPFLDFEAAFAAKDTDLIKVVLET
jgi:threonine dehydrogenase-like Zn-dependent dehydrogenase